MLCKIFHYFHQEYLQKKNNSTQSPQQKILQEKGIEATIRLSESPNSKVIVIGSGESGLPIILGNQ